MIKVRIWQDHLMKTTVSIALFKQMPGNPSVPAKGEILRIAGPDELKWEEFETGLPHEPTFTFPGFLGHEILKELGKELAQGGFMPKDPETPRLIEQMQARIADLQKMIEMQQEIIREMGKPAMLLQPGKEL